MIKNNTVYSESGRKLSRQYPTKKGAVKRLKQIEYFKHEVNRQNAGKYKSG